MEGGVEQGGGAPLLEEVAHDEAPEVVVRGDVAEEGHVDAHSN